MTIGLYRRVTSALVRFEMRRLYPLLLLVVLTSSLTVGAAAITETFAATIERSSRAANAQQDVTITLQPGDAVGSETEPLVLPTEQGSAAIGRASISWLSGQRSVDVMTDFTADEGAWSALGVDVASTGMSSSGSVALSTLAAEILDVELGDQVAYAEPGEAASPATVERIFELPADPFAVSAVLRAPAPPGALIRVVGPATLLTQVERLSRESRDAFLVSTPEGRAAQLLDGRTPELVRVAGLVTPIAILTLCALSWASGFALRRRWRRHLRALAAAGCPTTAQVSVVLGALLVPVTVSAVMASLVTIAVLEAVARSIGDSVFQSWSGIDVDVATVVRSVLLVSTAALLPLGTTILVTPRPATSPATGRRRLLVVGVCLLLLGLALVAYLWITDGSTPGFYAAGVLAPLVLGTAAALLAMTLPHRAGGSALGSVLVRASRSNLMPALVLAVTVGAATFIVGNGTAVTHSLLRAYEADLPDESIVLEMVPEAATRDVMTVAADFGLAVVTYALPSESPEATRATTPRLAQCLAGHVGGDFGEAMGHCTREAPADLLLVGLDDGATGSAVRASNRVVEDGRVGVVQIDDDNRLVASETIAAATDSSLGGTYLPDLLLPISPEGSTRVAVERSGMLALAIPGALALPAVDFASFRQQLESLTSTSLAVEESGYSDGGAYLVTRFVAAVAALTSVLVILMTASALRRGTEQWEHLVVHTGLRRPHRVLLFLRLTLPLWTVVAAGFMAGLMTTSGATNSVYLTDLLGWALLPGGAAAVTLGSVGITWVRRVGSHGIDRE